MATTSISQMTTAATVDNGDLFEIAHPDAGSATGYASNKQSMAAIADHMATAVNYPTMNTTAKTIIGAINELEAGGGGGGSSTLAGLTDVEISTPTNGQTLVYDANAAKWKNGAGGGGGGYYHAYSKTEHVVGEWIDGSAIYEQTFEFDPIIELRTTYSHSGVIISELALIVDAVATDLNGQTIPVIVGLYNNKELALAVSLVLNTGIKYLTLQYTKVSS